MHAKISGDRIVDRRSAPKRGEDGWLPLTAEGRRPFDAERECENVDVRIESDRVRQIFSYGPYVPPPVSELEVKALRGNLREEDIAGLASLLGLVIERMEEFEQRLATLEKVKVQLVQGVVS
jgi:hypothetical protein